MTDTYEETIPVAEEATPVEAEPTPEPAVDAATTPEAEAAEKTRRGRGALEAQVKSVCDDFVTGTLTLPENGLLTPHRIAKTVQDRGGDKASTGAVAAVLARWQEYGFAVINEKPMAFSDYTEAGVNEGLAALKAAYSEKKRGARAAAKAAEKAAAPAAAPVEAEAQPEAVPVEAAPGTTVVGNESNSIPF